MAAATGALTALAALAGLPSPSLFAALVVGLAVALRGPASELPPPAALTGQAVLGVALGSYVRLATLTEAARHWAPVLGVTLATLALSLGAGVLVARLGRVDLPTASLGMIAGGASGIVAMSHELGADDRLVAIMQYLRVLVIVVLTPILYGLLGGGGHAHGPHGGGGGGPGPVLAWLALILVSAGVGVPAARRARIPAGTLLGPMLVSGVITVTGILGGARVPGLVQGVAFAVIGLQVGLRFTPESVRRAGRLLPLILGGTLALILACGLLALALAPLAGVSRVDAYLATTPGGLYAVLATALGGGANTTFILAVQTLRLLAMVLAAPVLARRLAAFGRRRASPVA